MLLIVLVLQLLPYQRKPYQWYVCEYQDAFKHMYYYKRPHPLIATTDYGNPLLTKI